MQAGVDSASRESCREKRSLVRCCTHFHSSRNVACWHSWWGGLFVPTPSKLVNQPGWLPCLQLLCVPTFAGKKGREKGLPLAMVELLRNNENAAT
ncbi:hypothetical protein V6N13_122603 [Hibiscus sabdariffa]|uniref:Uncharacterized protein n=2 Tax=Hibiscus sabdariffa TaxID=183260 RepID=A0ABR2AVU7_9ROSI